ncbi:LLM class flavin-dependent oxidoreductase [Nocardioides sp. AE5]|uniref:LLM class flavin-dependent oxidoreductase n=1 Tax=Nocardioides sp. AE5 TaxID=2962573 RepID=UPI0028822A53|nr:LLM class flavin-dependent oxidoreductase [Nocardioides sp. AE5]MDT0202490.1 LLM class flavin-dependent oxidoreductase [Nocardioides sp. AE5]
MGVGLFPTEPVATMREYTQLAESLGYANVWFGDSQNIWRESSVTMGASAVGTEKIVFGTGVTNAVTRHRSLLASTWATLSEFTGGRVALGIGTGDSSLRTMGLKPLKLAELEEAVGELRTLFAGDAVAETSSGADFHLNYVTEPMDIPIYVAASAPKILELSGKIADGVIILVGTSPVFIEAALETIEKGARASGRTLDDLHLVLWTPTAIADDPVKARDLARAHVARVCIRPLPAKVDPSLEAAITKIRDSYDYYHHMDTEANHADIVPDELVDLFALAGTPDECRARLTEISALPIDQVSIIPFVRPGESRAETMKTFAQLVSEIGD